MVKMIYKWNTFIYLVGGFNHLEKYEFVNGKDDIPYIMENKCSITNITMEHHHV